MEKMTVKRIIAEKEQDSWNCGGRLCDYFVFVRNLRERKRYYVADVIVKDQGGDVVERFNDCEYNKEIFDLI